MTDPLAIAAHVSGILEQLGIRYVLGGSLASTTFGEPRATLDVDLAADIRKRDVDPFVDALESDFGVDREWVRDEVDRHGSFQALHNDTMVRIDVFVPEWSGFDLWKWEHRRRVEVPPRSSIDVTSPEAIALQKLVWFKKGGEVSDRQWRDVVGVLKAQTGSLDNVALHAWATKLGVNDLLLRAREQATP